MNSDGSTSANPAPVLRIVRGSPAPEEVAALVAVLSTRAAPPAGSVPGQGGATPAGSQGGSRWSDRARTLRRPLHPGPGAWLASAWPG